jgi:glycosidase
VQAEIFTIMGFWLELGVSGFRMDAVPFVIATKGAAVAQPVEQFDMLRSFREFLQWRRGEAIILAEANVRLTNEQREAVFAAFGPDPSMRLHGRGIRRRLMPRCSMTTGGGWSSRPA